MPESNIADYEIVRQVGGDATSALYKARRSLPGERAEQRVLLRIFNQSLSPAHYDQNLQWAMKAAESLSNPGILHIIDWGSTDDEKPYLVIEHAVGYTLATWLDGDDTSQQSSPAPAAPLTALTLIYHLALILEGALKQGIVHRDLQPDQILLTPQDDAQPHGGPVALMGLDLPYSLATMGHEEDTPLTRYLSPEQKQDKALDARSNMYSLAMLLYDLLGGEQARAAPREALPPLDTLAPHLSEATQRLVRRGLQPELWKRYHNYNHFMEALREAIGAEGGDVEALPAPPVEAEPPGTPPATVSPTPTLPSALRIALAQVGILALLLVGSFLLLRNGSVQETSAGDTSPAEPTPSGLFSGVQWTATPSPTPSPSATTAATSVATTAAAPLLPPTPSASPSPSATATEPAATATLSASPSPAPTMTATALPPPPPTATPAPPTATSQPPPPPTATSEPPPPPPPPTATSAPPPPTAAPTATESPPTPTPPSPVEDAAPHRLSGGSPGA